MEAEGRRQRRQGWRANPPEVKIEDQAYSKGVHQTTAEAPTPRVTLLWVQSKRGPVIRSKNELCEKQEEGGLIQNFNPPPLSDGAPGYK